MNLGTSINRKCSGCKYSTGGGRNPFSDICDGCTHDPETGFGGFRDHSLKDENGDSLRFSSDKEQEELYALLRSEDDGEMPDAEHCAGSPFLPVQSFIEEFDPSFDDGNPFSFL